MLRPQGRVKNGVLDLAVLGNLGRGWGLGEESPTEPAVTEGNSGALGKGQRVFQKEPSGLQVRGGGRQPQGQTEARIGKATSEQLSPQSEDVNDLEKEHQPIITGRWPQLSNPHTQGRGGGLFPQPEFSSALCQAK